MQAKSLIKILLFVLGIGILALMVIISGPSNIWNAAKGSDWQFAVSGLVVFALYLFVRSLRWHVMLKAIKDDVKLGDFMPIYFINFMISNITPGRSGEAAAPFLMKRHIGADAGMGFSIVIVDRILDVLFTVILAVVGFIYCTVFLDLPQSLTIAFYPAIAILIAMTGVMLMVVLWRKGAFLLLRSFTGVFFKKRQRQMLDGLDSFYEGLRILKRRKVTLKLLACVTLSWALLAFSYFLRVRAVIHASALPILACWIISLCIGMASFIPSGLGSSQASFAYLLSFTGSDLAGATTAALLTKFVALGAIFTLGLSSLFWIRRGNVMPAETEMMDQ